MMMPMNLFSATGLDRLNPAQGGSRGMRIVATGLLIAMAAIYLATRHYEPMHPAFGYLRAFAEAAMVGGLADWFAVTALFRHPLGLPIPHTAIIPRNKDRIGDTLALFLRDNFLTASVVTRRMRKLDIAGAIGRWLSNPTQSSRISEGAGRLLADVVEALADEKLGGMIKGAAVARLKAIDFAPLLGQMLEAAIDQNRHVPILERAIEWAGRMLDANDALIRQIVHDRANAILRWTGLDEKLSDAIIEGLGRLIRDIAADPEHPLRGEAEAALARFAMDLSEDPAMRDRIAALRDALVANPAVAAWIDGMWQTLRASIVRGVRNPDAIGSGGMGEAMLQLGETLSADLRLRLLINRFIRRAVVGTVASYGDGIVKLVSETIRGWDARTITSRLESAVGRDLQYIRVNGTLVGGLVGLGLHALDGVL